MECCVPTAVMWGAVSHRDRRLVPSGRPMAVDGLGDLPFGRRRSSDIELVDRVDWVSKPAIINDQSGARIYLNSLPIAEKSGGEIRVEVR